MEVEVGVRGIYLGWLDKCVGIPAEFGARVLRLVTDTALHQPSQREVGAGLTRLVP